MSSTGGGVEALLAEARRGLDRVAPTELEAEVTAGALVIDTRTHEQRRREGPLPGALVIDRNVLEWRLDPASPHRIPEMEDPHQRVIVVCNEGYGSSLAADSLRRIGLTRVTDLAGGFQAWRAEKDLKVPRTRRSWFRGGGEAPT
jgi:rhodanese-related sulfurtransferase